MKPKSNRNTDTIRSPQDTDILPLKFDFYQPIAPSVSKKAGQLSLGYARQISAELETKSGALWITMNGKPRPCFHPEMLTGYISLVSDIENRSAVFHDESGCWPQIHYVIVKSSTKEIFSVGGDVDFLCRLISDRDVKSLRNYAKACLDPLIRFSRGFHLPLQTISLVQGTCLSGGFELALAGDMIIAERQSMFGLPDIRLNLFSGMGATSFLLRRVGERTLKTITDSGRQFSADEMLELGVVDQVVDPGCGERTVRDLIAARASTVSGRGAMSEARRIVRGDLSGELMQITELWIQTALRMNRRELTAMQRLAMALVRN